jgi:hypothetical protein
MAGDSTDDKELHPLDKLLIQKYILAVVALYGTIALGVLGLIGSFVLSSVQSSAKEAARDAVKEALERKREQFKDNESQIRDGISLLNRGIGDAQRQAGQVQEQVCQLALSVDHSKSDANEKMRQAQEAAELASKSAVNAADAARAKVEQIEKAQLQWIIDKAPKVSAALKDYTSQMSTYANQVKTYTDEISILRENLDKFRRELSQAPRIFIAGTEPVEMKNNPEISKFVAVTGMPQNAKVLLTAQGAGKGPGGDTGAGSLGPLYHFASRVDRNGFWIVLRDFDKIPHPDVVPVDYVVVTPQ